MGDPRVKEICILIEQLLEYNQRVGQIFELTFEKLREEGIDPFVIEDTELIEAIKKRYKGVLDEDIKRD